MSHQETLSTASLTETSLLSFLISGGAMALLDGIVLACVRTHLKVFHPSQIGQLAQRGVVAPELVSHDPFGRAVFIKQP
jgi:hypothetical protein